MRMIDEEHLPDRNENALIVLVFNTGSPKDVQFRHRSSANGRTITSLPVNCYHIR